MKYKLIAMDMDGTLLTDKKEITERAKTDIKKAAEMGVKVAVCTGRLFASAKFYAGIIGTPVPVIASNGAYIRQKDTENIIYEKYMNEDEIITVVGMAKKYGFIPHIYTYNSIYSEKLSYSSKNYEKWNKAIPEAERVRIHIVKDLAHEVHNLKGKILKVFVASEDCNKIYELKQKIINLKNYSVVSSGNNNFEVMAKGVLKGSAVRILADYYGIKQDEVICIGDSENDKSMIEYAGLGIAMGNAEKGIKDIAGFITDTNENDGVAKAIEKFVL